MHIRGWPRGDRGGLRPHFCSFSGMCENRCEIKKPPEAAGRGPVTSPPQSAIDPFLCPVLMVSMRLYSVFLKSTRRPLFAPRVPTDTLSDDLGSPLGSPRGHLGAQNGSKTAQDGPKSAASWAQRPQRPANTHPRAPKTAQEAPSCRFGTVLEQCFERFCC